MVTVLLTLRVWGVYGQDRRIGIALFLIFIGCWAAAFAVIGFWNQQVIQNCNQYSPSFSTHTLGCVYFTLLRHHLLSWGIKHIHHHCGGASTIVWFSSVYRAIKLWILADREIYSSIHTHGLSWVVHMYVCGVRETRNWLTVTTFY